jgi:hypothetical protein
MLPVCPKCDAALFVLHFKDVELDHCPECHGLWLDAGELETLMPRIGATTDDPLLQFQKQTGLVPPGKKHLCPRCDQPLGEITVERDGPARLTLDRCARGHGLWFDAEELPQLLALFPPQTGASKTVEFLNEFFNKPK